MPEGLDTLLYGFASCALLIVLLRARAAALGLVDVPDARKTHAVATPTVGGIALALAFIAAWLLSEVRFTGHLTLLAALCLVTGVGVWDDARGLSARAKLAVQLFASLVIATGSTVYVQHLGDLFGAGEVGLGKWGALFTVICLVGVMNAFNMIDGEDGLAGTLALVSLGALALPAYAGGERAALGLLCALSGALLGFLAFNLRTPWRARAAVFLGDAGSLFLGLAVAWFAIRLCGTEGAAARPVTAVWLLAVPLLDMGSVMIVRMRRGLSPFAADKRHLHYVLRARGLGVGRTVAAMGALAALLAGFGLWAEVNEVPEWLMFYLFLLLWALWYAALEMGAAGARSSR